MKIFNKIIEGIVSRIGNKNYGDENTACIWFKSGTVVNDGSFAATGYTFRFEAVNVSDSIVEEVFSDVYAQISKVFVDNNNKYGVNFVQHRKIPNSNAYEVAVAPRNELRKLNLW